MAKAARLSIIQKEGEEIEQKVLAKAICDIADAAKRLLNGPLTERAVIVLVQDRLVGIPKSTIKAVLQAATELKREYVR